MELMKCPECGNNRFYRQVMDLVKIEVSAEGTEDDFIGYEETEYQCSKCDYWVSQEDLMKIMSRLEEAEKVQAGDTGKVACKPI